MNIFGGLLIIIFTGIILMQLRMYLGSQKMKGNPIPEDLGELTSDFSGIESDSALLYFYSPSCAPCKSMTPIIDKISGGGKNAIKVNINNSPQVAVKFGIRATPTTLLIKNRIIEKVLLGAQSENYLISLLYSK